MLSKVHDFDLIFTACLYTLRSHEVALFHAYIFIDFLWLLFLAGRIWPLMRLSIFFDLLLNVKRATFFIAAKQSFRRGSWFPIVLQNALYE